MIWGMSEIRFQKLYFDGSIGKALVLKTQLEVDEVERQCRREISEGARLEELCRTKMARDFILAKVTKDGVYFASFSIPDHHELQWRLT